MRQDDKRRGHFVQIVLPVLLLAALLIGMFWSAFPSQTDTAQAPSAEDANAALNALGQVEVFLPGEIELTAYHEKHTGIRNYCRLGAVALTQEQAEYLASLTWDCLPMPQDMREEILPAESDLFGEYALYAPLAAAAQGAGRYRLIDRSGMGPHDGCVYWTDQFTLLLWDEEANLLYFMSWDA